MTESLVTVVLRRSIKDLFMLLLKLLLAPRGLAVGLLERKLYLGSLWTRATDVFGAFWRKNSLVVIAAVLKR